MKKFLLSQLDGQSGAGVYDLCLDHKLVAEWHPEKFKELKGLEMFPDLQQLYVQMQALENLDNLPLLPKLNLLDLSFNELVEIPALNFAFPALRDLFLSHNAISSLSALPESLQNLQLDHNALEGQLKLTGPSQLKELNLSGNRQLKGLVGDFGLLERLALRNCHIAQWEWLQNMPNLQALTLSPPPRLPDALAQHQPKLQKLILSAQRVGDQLHLQPMPALQSLSIAHGRELENISGLEGMTSLKELELTNLGLRTLPHSLAQSKVETLILKQLPSLDLKVLMEMPHLKLVQIKHIVLPPEGLKPIKIARPELKIEVL